MPGRHPPHHWPNRARACSPSLRLPGNGSVADRKAHLLVHRRPCFFLCTSGKTGFSTVVCLFCTSCAYVSSLLPRRPSRVGFWLLHALGGGGSQVYYTSREHHHLPALFPPSRVSLCLPFSRPCGQSLEEGGAGWTVAGRHALRDGVFGSSLGCPCALPTRIIMLGVSPPSCLFVAAAATHNPYPHL